MRGAYRKARQKQSTGLKTRSAYEMAGHWSIVVLCNTPVAGGEGRVVALCVFARVLPLLRTAAAALLVVVLPTINTVQQTNY